MGAATLLSQLEMEMKCQMSEQSRITSGKGLVLGGAELVVGLMLELLVGG